MTSPMDRMAAKLAEEFGHYFMHPEPLMPDPGFDPRTASIKVEAGPINGMRGFELAKYLQSYDNLLGLLFRIEIQHPGKKGQEIRLQFHEQIKAACLRYGLPTQQIGSTLYAAKLAAFDFLDARWQEKLARDKLEVPSG